MDVDGHRTEYFYNENGDLIRTQYFDGTYESYEYDNNGNKTAHVDKLGRRTEYLYDSRNRQIKTIYPDTSFTETIYNQLGQVEAQVDANGNRTEFEYDEAGRKVLERNALTQETTYVHDSNGNVLDVTTPDNQTVSFEYDALNRKIRTFYPSGAFDEVGYDSLGRVKAKTDANGNTTQFEYDSMGRLVKVTDALLGETVYSYDERGHKLSETDAKSQTTSWGYDYLGRVVRRTLPLGQEETFTYNQRGLKIRHNDFNNYPTHFDYDEHNRLRCVWTDDTPNGLCEEEYYYNDIGQRTIVWDSRGKTLYGYDPLRGRLESVENYNSDNDLESTLSYQYDFNGNRISVTAPSGTTAYTFDALNRIETVTDPDSNETSYTYALNGKQHTVSYPNGTWAEYFYDSNGRLIKLENKKSDNTVVGSYEYELDNVGNRLSVDEDNSRRLISYTYDDLNRLLTETIVVSGAPDTLTHTYTYDAVGNRLSKETCEGTTCETITYQYNINNQLISETGDSQSIGYSYDSNGNTVAKYDMAQPEPPLWEYQYDFKNRMVTAEEPTQQVVEFAYDVDGIRVQKSVDGISTDYLIDSNRPFAQVLEEREDDDTLLAAYVFGNDLISQTRGTTENYFHYDGLGSTRLLSDVTEGVTDSYDFEAFGNILEQTGTTENVYLFTGEQHDPETGMIYLRARLYNPTTGRFLTMDAHPGDPNDPLSLHKYLYAADNPVVNVDPSGLFSLIQMNVTVAIVGILSSVAFPSYGAYVGTEASREKTILYFNAIPPHPEYDAPPEELGGSTAYSEEANRVFYETYLNMSMLSKGWTVKPYFNATVSAFDRAAATPINGKVAVVIFSHLGRAYLGVDIDYPTTIKYGIGGSSIVVGTFLAYCNSYNDARYLDSNLAHSVANEGFPGRVFPSNKLLRYAYESGKQYQGMYSAEEWLPFFFSKIANVE